VLVALLGLNISAIGLVVIPSGSLVVIAELFGLIVVLNAVYVLVFIMLDKTFKSTLTYPNIPDRVE
jgi:hypothetical protein